MNSRISQPARKRARKKGETPRKRSAAGRALLTVVFAAVVALSLVALGYFVVGLLQAAQGFYSEGFGKVAIGIALGLPAIVAGFFMVHGGAPK